MKPLGVGGSVRSPAFETEADHSPLPTELRWGSKNITYSRGLQTTVKPNKVTQGHKRCVVYGKDK